ncbi:hypothetical protein MXD95_007290, partial [Frankia sp. AiPa1]|nr:hypothetical protein [Frankia sp. AiPa1]
MHEDDRTSIRPDPNITTATTKATAACSKESPHNPTSHTHHQDGHNQPGRKRGGKTYLALTIGTLLSSQGADAYR